MSIELWLAFIAASAILLIIPGPTGRDSTGPRGRSVFVDAKSGRLARGLFRRRARQPGERQSAEQKQRSDGQ